MSVVLASTCAPDPPPLDPDDPVDPVEPVDPDESLEHATSPAPAASTVPATAAVRISCLRLTTKPPASVLAEVIWSTSCVAVMDAVLTLDQWSGHWYGRTG
jgi:hypothetical protein